MKNNENGLTVPPNDPAALAAAIRRIATDPELATKFSAAGRATVEAGFSSGRSAEALVNGLREHAGWTQVGPELRTGH